MTAPLNEFLVGLHADQVVVMVRIPHRLSPERALGLAAWLALIADPAGDEFAGVLDAVRNTGAVRSTGQATG